MNTHPWLAASHLRRVGELAAATVLAPSLFIFAAGVASGQTIDSKLWTVNDFGAVSDIVRVENTIYIGGSFTEVGPCTGHGVPVSATTGEPAKAYPRIGGEVDAVVADGHGGWFIGGNFVSVAGSPRQFLARVQPDGSLSTWDPAPNEPVAALCVTGDTLYVGGSFTTCNGVTRHRGAAFDIRTGRLTDWDPKADAAISAIATEGSVVYIGGRFSTLDTTRRANLAAVDGVIGLPTGWNPGADSVVLALAVNGDEVYAGGYFHHVGGAARSLIAAIDRRDGTVLPWSWVIDRTSVCDQCDVGPFVDALTVDGNHLYFGGSFTHVDMIPRTGAAAITLSSHALGSWDPQLAGVAPLPYCRSLATSQGVVYIGGRFDGLKGVARPYAAAVDTNGVVTAWNPRPDVSVTCVATAGATVYIGGDFSSVWNWQPRRFLAALDAVTGEVMPWSPNPNNVVGLIRVSGKTVYVAGAFDTIAGQQRTCLAAVDAVSGEATQWNPSVDAGIYPPVRDMVVRGGAIYVCGLFSGLGGESRYCIGAVDSVTGHATPWNPQVDDIVETMAMQGDTLYIGGWFSHVASTPRSFLAAVDTGGALLDWNPDPDDVVRAMAVAEGNVFVGGLFSHVSGQPRGELAAIDRITGAVSDWVADAGPQVQCLAVADDVLYVGGWFSQVGGEARDGLAAIESGTGAILPWNPKPNGTVAALYPSDGVLYVGGTFDYLGFDLRPGLAAISLASGQDPGPVPQPGHLLAVAQNAPNPVRTGTIIRFGLSVPARVTLSVFDLAGRCIATPLKGAERGAGPHQVELSAATWPSGVYYYRLDAAGVIAARKMVVVK